MLVIVKNITFAKLNLPLKHRKLKLHIYTEEMCKLEGEIYYTYSLIWTNARGYNSLL